MEESYVYILANRPYGTLYIGATTDLINRVWQHKNNFVAGFTAKYHIHQLVYYEMHQDIHQAAIREQRLKNWCRAWKLTLIEKFNPNWYDLYKEINA